MATKIKEPLASAEVKAKPTFGQAFLKKLKHIGKMMKNDYQLYIFLIPAVVFFVLFCYMPMYGVQIAFKDFVEVDGIGGSAWADPLFKHFTRFFGSYQFWNLLKNTLILSFLNLLITFPIPIALALLLNQTRSQRLKKVVQTVTYAPHFISIVVLVGMLQIFLSPRNGFVNNIIQILGGDPILFLGAPEWFRTVYIGSDVWQNTGWSAIIYIAALAGVDPGLYDAARVDGCSRFKIIRYIDFPSILPTAIILLIMNSGKVMSLGFQKVFLLQNAQNVSVSEIIATYTYKLGIIDTQYSYSAAVGLFNSIINILLLVAVNQISKKLSDTSLW